MIMTSSSFGTYFWNRTTAATQLVMACEYSTQRSNQVTRICDERGNWMSPVLHNCLTRSASMLNSIKNVSSSTKSVFLLLFFSGIYVKY